MRELFFKSLIYFQYLDFFPNKVFFITKAARMKSFHA